MSKKKGYVPSLLTAIDEIEYWLTIPVGFFVSRPKFGNNLHLLAFKNPERAREVLSTIFAKLQDDLGVEVASSVDELSLATVEGYDKFVVIIRYNNNNISIGNQ